MLNRPARGRRAKDGIIAVSHTRRPFRERCQSRPSMPVVMSRPPQHRPNLQGERIPALSALAIWAMLGGHLYAPETLNLLFGQLLYGLLVGAISLFAASISEGS